MSRQVLPPGQVEQRRSILSEGDLDAIGRAFDDRMNSMFEIIGYDISTPESRAEINKDHQMVRDARKAKALILSSFFIGVGAAIASFLGIGVKH